MTDFIDDFLNQLEADKPKPRADFSKLTKLTMSSQDNQGTVLFAPFKNPKDSKYYRILDGVREIKTTTPLFHDGNDEVWIRILKADDYANLTQAQLDLYTEVIGLFDQYYDMVDANEKLNTWDMIRYRSYSVFQGIILMHSNPLGVANKDHENVAALLIYPSKAPIAAMSDAISSKIANSKGSKAWLPAVFAPGVKGREGALSIQFIRKGDNQIGYNTAVAFEFNSSYNQVIDPDLELPEDTLNLFGDFADEFLGWQNGEGGLFNEALFVNLKKTLQIAINALSKTPSTEPAPENKNGQDPMIGSGPSVSGDNAGNVQSQQGTQPQANSTGAKGNFPF